jgi:hypothetical protein
MKLRLSVLAILAVLASVLVLAPMTSAAPKQSSSVPTAVIGTIPGGGAFTGTLDITQIVAQNGQLFAIGTLTGTLTDAVGNVIGTVTNLPVMLPLSVSGTCPVLHLTLGPLDLNLLGLTVHLDQVVLDISAQAGPGNLLGNLVCVVAHLLDNPAATLNAIVTLLNNLLGL